MLYSLIDSLFRTHELSPDFLMELMVFCAMLQLFDCIMSLIRKM